MHKGLRQLTGESSGILTYDQLGFDIYFKDDRTIDATHIQSTLLPGKGTDADQYFYFNHDTKFPHWIGIQNISPEPTSETIQIQAVTASGDFLSKNGNIEPGEPLNYIELREGDMVFGVFTQVLILKTASPVYKDYVKLIRGM